MKEKFLKIWKETLLLGILLLLIVIGVRVGVYHFVLTKDYETFMDTQTYSYLEQYNFEKFNSFRTPVYPIFIRVIGLFGDASTEQLYTNVATAQELISLASVFICYLTMRKMTKNRIIQSIATLWYGCLPSIFHYNLCILTESLSISFMMIFFYTFVCYLQNKKIIQQILLAIETLFLILLRPSFLYLLIFFAIFWGISFFKEKENRKKVGIGVLTTVTVGIAILGYVKMNQIQNGIKGLSYVNVINQADIIIGMRLYGSYENNPRDDEITKIIDEGVKEEKGPWYSLKEKIPYADLEGYMKKCVKYNRKRYILANITKLLELGSNSVNTIVATGKPSQERIQTNDLITLSRVALPVTFAFCYFMIAVEMITFLWRRLRKEIWTMKEQIRFYAVILIGGMIAVTILGAQAEFQRLIAPILSIIILVCASYLEKITEKESK